MKSFETIDIQDWESGLSEEIQSRAAHALEQGQVIYLPHLNFQLSAEEKKFLTPTVADPKKKNVSYDLRSDHLAGVDCSVCHSDKLKGMIKRFALNSRRLLERLIPQYQSHLIQAKTSFRPVEIQNRKTSPRKNDTLLHVDSFPSNPVKGQRILRVFSNINTEGKPRVWRVGESFENVVKKIGPRVAAPIPGIAYFLQLLKITKDYRTAYDHYMLQIHNTMKEDADYQKTVQNEQILFPPGSSWIVYTDQVSHAAMAGQHVLEQTFHLPVNGLVNPATSPLRVLEKYFNRQLV